MAVSEGSLRSTWVDCAKAIGISLVVFGHVWRGLHAAGILKDDRFFQLVDSIIYSFHMPLFFFLSGLFIRNSYSKQGPDGFLLGKIDTILYPYLLWSVLQGTVELLFNGYKNDSVNLREIFSLWNPRAQFWFLYALLVMCVASAFIFRCFGAAAVLIQLSLSGTLYFLAASLSWTGIALGICGNFVYFALGIALGAGVFSTFSEKQSTMLASAALLILSQYFWIRSEAQARNWESVFLMPSLAIVSIGCVCVFSASMPRWLSNQLGRLGQLTMPIYLLHILSAAGARIIVYRVFGIESALAHVILGCVAGIAMPVLISRFAEYMKVQYIFGSPGLSHQVSQWIRAKL